MQWFELWPAEHQPTQQQIAEFTQTPLWGNLAEYLQNTYSVSPKYAYSRCALDKGLWKGWNVKYAKTGKSLCTLYPKQGWFLALVTVGAGEAAEADLLIPMCDEYTQQLYHSTKQHPQYGRMLAFEVKTESVLADVKSLAALRVHAKKKKAM